MIPELEQQHWLRWINEHCKDARDWLFSLYLPWSKAEAQAWQRKVFLSLADLDDFRQYAALGLLEAISQFDPQLGYKFVFFARFRVKGAILNEVFRYSDESAQIHTAYRLGESIEVANTVSTDPLAELSQSIEELTLSLLLNDTLVEHPQSWIYGDYYSSTEIASLKISYMDKLLHLEDPIQSIMLFRYKLDWDFTDIASTLGLSKGRVSQLHKEAIEQLKSTKRTTTTRSDIDILQFTGLTP